MLGEDGEKGEAKAGEGAAIAWALAAIFLWGTLAAVVGDALEGVKPASLVLWSFVFSAPTLVLVELFSGKSLRSVFVATPGVVVLGLWGIFGYHALFFYALDLAPIVQANLLNYLWPLFMVLLAPVLAREKLSAASLAGALVGFVGAALVVTQGRGVSIAREHLLGYGLAALAAFAWASFSVLLRRLGRAGEGRMALFVTASIPPALVLAAVTGGAAPPHGRALAAAAFLGIGPMGLAFACWGKALARGSAARIGALSYLDPLLSTLGLALFLKKPLGGQTVLGMALIIAGAAAPSLFRRRPTEGGPS